MPSRSLAILKTFGFNHDLSGGRETKLLIVILFTEQSGKIRTNSKVDKKALAI